MKFKCLFIYIKRKLSDNRQKTLNLEEVFKSVTRTTTHHIRNIDYPFLYQNYTLFTIDKCKKHK